MRWRTYLLRGRRSVAGGIRESRPLIRASVAADACSAAASAAWWPEPKVPSSMSMAWPCAVATIAEVSRAAAVSSPLASSACLGTGRLRRCLRGACDLRMAVLASPEPARAWKQGPLVVREANVGLGRCSEPLCRGPGCGRAVKLLGEKTGCPERNGGQAGRLCRRSAGTARRPRHLGAGSPPPSRTPQRRARRVAQQRSGSAPPAGHRGGSGRAWPVRAQPDPRGSLRYGEGHHAAHERVPPAIARTRRATGARRAWEPTL